jgi:quinol monooxygenase YgiN
MAEISTTADHATFINVFRVRPEDQDDVVEVLIEIMEGVAKGRHGFISASCHRSAEGTHVFMYLQWQTPEDLKAMQESPEFGAIARRFAGRIQFESHRCEVVHVTEA